MEYLTFEKPIEDLIIKLEKVKELGEEGGIDISKTIEDLEKKSLLQEKISMKTFHLGKEFNFLVIHNVHIL